MIQCVSRCGAIDRVLCARVALFATAALLTGLPTFANEEASDSTNAEQLWSGGGLGLDLTGAGVTVGVWEAFDNGNWEVRDTHEAFRSFNPLTGQWDGPSRVTFGDTPEPGTGSGSFADHATHVAGTIGGAHLPGRRSTWGMAPGVQIVSFDVFSDTSEMRQETQIDISNHSYGFNRTPWQLRSWPVSNGSGGTVSRTYDTWVYDWDTTDEDPAYGRYDSNARSMDQTLIARPKLLSFFSAGNSRNDPDDVYSDIQGDGKFVTRFSSSFIANNTIIGESLGNRYYLVSTSDYSVSGHGFDPGGFDSLSGDAVAKNNVVIGATLDFTSDPHEDFKSGIRTTGFSSYGPTDDGGLGVDLVANGNSLDSASDGFDTDYTRKSGTSMSAPNAAGTAALILEHWRNENGGFTPDSATQKGLLMHTATDATRYGIGPDYATGYGMINAVEAVGYITESIDEPGATRDRHIWEDTLLNGDTLTLEFLTTGGDFKASLSWLDPAAPSGPFVVDDRASKLVNDLNIWVTDSLGNTYWSWVLDPDNPNDDATQDAHNRVDNFTQVFIDSPAVDTELTLHIDHFGSLSGGSQDYALFVSGAVVAPDILELVLGDMNGDGLLSNDDINPFVMALIDRPGYETLYTGIDADVAGDFSGDGVLDNLDIFGFTSALNVGPTALAEAFDAVLSGDAGLDVGVPEPGSLALLAMSGLLIVRRR